MPNIRNSLSVSNDAELLSYIINQDPTLKEEVGLPVQGEDIAPIGKLIISNPVYKNAFLNVVNVIGLTIIDSKSWRSPWDEFTEKGSLEVGESVREVFVELANVYDYNAHKDDVDHFLENVVPNVYEYMHEINYEKFYKTSTSDEEIAMAFNTRGGLFKLIEAIIKSLYEGYEYDKYIVAKYLLCRRILDGTLAVHKLTADTIRGKVAEMKEVSNKMTFRKPYYNPAGVRNFSAFEDQFFIMDSSFDGEMSVEVLATSYFRNDALLKSNRAIADGFSEHDTNRLIELLGLAYEEFSSDDLTALATIPAVIVDREFFQFYNYFYDTRATEFFNPETLRNNHWLHTKKVISSSPFAPAVVFTTLTPNISSVTVSPSAATVNVGQKLQLTATVVNVGFANKSVKWSVDDDAKADGVKIDVNGLLSIPSDAEVQSITVTATSIYKGTVSGTATITVAGNESPTPDTTPETTPETTPATTPQ